MKLYQVIMGLILMTLLMGCEGNNNKAKEAKLDRSHDTTNRSIESGVISGQVVIQQRVALPVNAVVTVTLADTSIAELPALILSQKYYDTQGKQSPFPFELSYQKDEIRSSAHLVVRATVSVEGDIWFISNVESVVINNGVTRDIELRLVPAQ
ncbi:MULTISPECIES: YbaY family lipoprotein [Providencia]|uniref:Lipoprotein n=1 Tax=Providencia stuartii TaxID=588 RepID=A0A1S1HTH7_PROST|nr:YbaY family lipoprotein [Providencia stuartii]MDV5228256.1 YbaY family lipoprotein [Providencia rettgeri]OHT24696.1 hypothetical protein A3Q29_03025 [Providencia stuartii]